MLTEGTSSLRAWEMRERETNELLFPLGQKWDLFIATRPLLGQCQFITPPKKNYIPGSEHLQLKQSKHNSL